MLRIIVSISNSNIQAGHAVLYFWGRCSQIPILAWLEERQVHVHTFTVSISSNSSIYTTVTRQGM